MKKSLTLFALLTTLAQFSQAMDNDSYEKCFTNDNQVYRMGRVLHALSERGSAFKVINPIAAESKDCLDFQRKLEDAVDKRLAEKLDR